MAKVTGQVQAISSKKVGRGFAYSFLLDDNQWYRHGFDKPKFEKGFYVQFDDGTDQYGVIDKSTLKFKKGTIANDQSSAQVASKAGGAKGGQSENWEARQKYWDDKDKRDVVKDTQYVYRAAYFGAVDIIKCLVEKDKIELPKTKPLDRMLALIDGLTEDLYAKFKAVGIEDTQEQSDVKADPVDDTPPPKKGRNKKAPDPVDDEDVDDDSGWDDLEDADDWMD
jgi:hypothetical protein